MSGALLVLAALLALCSDPPQRGLLCELESVGSAARDARVVDRLALHVEAGAPASELLPAGPFRARWSGHLALDLRSRLRFRLVGRGAATLSLGGAVVLRSGGSEAPAPGGGDFDVASEEARFNQGPNALQLDYVSPADGAAKLRVLWAGRGFDWEPLPPALLARDGALDPAPLLAVRRGRELFAAHRCIRCHAPDAAPLDATGTVAPIPDAMVELAQAAPSLERAGERLRADWIAHWLVEPRALRPTARMPALLGGGDLAAHLAAGDTRALDLAAFLAARGTQGEAAAGAAAPLSGDATAVRDGGRLFAQRGCIACHTRPDSGSDDPSGVRLPLHRVAWKWQPEALVAFLQEPTAHDRWSRMPDLHLSEAEARALAAFLLERAARHVPAPVAANGAPFAGDASRGKEAFAALRCGRCHELAEPQLPSAAPAKPTAALFAADWNARGCVASSASRAQGPAAGAALPDYRFGAEERGALAAFAASGAASLARSTPLDFAERQLRELQCSACHAIGAELDRWQSLAAETTDLLAGFEPPHLDQARPPLTFVGEKLHGDWIESLLSGANAAPTRPWLAARMPAFPARATLLAEGLAARDGLAKSAAASEPPDAALEAIGAELVSERAFGCIACHDIGARGALSRFEFGTPNLDLAHGRIRPDYYRRWMANPLRVEPSSKMPRYAGDDGKSPFPDFCEGDLDRQFEAIRRHLARLHAQRR
ncbi:MAG: cytochrome c [Planctomycetes bacterium]|nr:cytochrome c [Planctomycetota bacterium]